MQTTFYGRSRDEHHGLVVHEHGKPGPLLDPKPAPDGGRYDYSAFGSHLYYVSVTQIESVTPTCVGRNLCEAEREPP